MCVFWCFCVILILEPKNFSTRLTNSRAAMIFRPFSTVWQKPFARATSSNPPNGFTDQQVAAWPLATNGDTGVRVPLFCTA